MTAETPTGRLAGKVGIVTGAAGAIGSAAARAFRDQGAVVGLWDQPGDGLEALRAEFGERGHATAVDVADEDQVRDAAQHWTERFAYADFVYVCAGIQLHGLDGPIHAVSLSTFQQTVEVNLTGAFLSVKHTIALLVAADAGSLILCGSPTGMTLSGAGYSAYSASKAGMMSLARTAAADYAVAGVRANVIIPGPISGPLISELLDDPAVAQDLISGTPIGRLGTPGDMVGIAVFLASDESRFATGANFCVDGGMTVR